MPQATQSLFECETCGRRYAWNPQLAGKSVKCKCGGALTVPATAPGDGLYDLAPAPKAPEPPKLAPIAQAAEPVSYRTPEFAAMALEDLVYNKPRDLYVPIALIVFGTALQFARAFSQGPGIFLNPVAFVGINVTIDLAVLFIGILAAAKILGVNFGPVPTAVLKLCAISLGPDSIAWLAFWALGSGYGAIFAGIAVSLIIYWALFSYFFELDAQDTFYTVAIVYTMYMFTFYTVLFLLPSFFHK